MTNPVTSWRDFERAGWESHVDPYHRFFGPLCARLADPLLDAAGVVPGSRVLDACCGPGYVARRALERGALVDGIDIARAMVELAIAMCPAARFEVGDCEEMHYGDNSFDAVVCNIGLHHLTSPERGVAEFARVLRPDSRLSLTVWDENRSALAIVPKAIAAAGAIAPHDLAAPPNAAEYDTADELEPLLLSAGLHLESVQPVAFLQSYPSPRALWEGWLAAAIRTGPLFAAQSPEVQKAAHEAFDGLAAAYLKVDGTVALPVAFLLITAAKSP
jgi:SAM-dependent methyltransferase